MKESNGFFKDAYDLETTEQTKLFYSKWAQTYDKEIGEEADYQQPARCAIALDGLINDKTVPILDVGCGTGLSGMALANAGYSNIVGCDLSDEMLALAGKTNCYTRLFETDLNKPPIDIKSDSIAGIAAVGVFSFGHVAPGAIDEFIRVLKTGGVFVIGLNDHYYDEGSFPDKLNELENSNIISILSAEHGPHLKNVEGSTGWVISCRKI